MKFCLFDSISYLKVHLKIAEDSVFSLCHAFALSMLSVDVIHNKNAEDQVPGYVELKNSSEESLLPGIRVSEPINYFLWGIS